MKLIILITLVIILIIWLYTLYPRKFFIVPYYQPPRKHGKDQKIPKTICVVHHENKLTDLLKPNIQSLIEKNPDYSFTFYDENSSRKFILEHFGERYLKAYNKLIPGAYKADFFRYCYMYIKGGVYIDINKKLLVPLDNIIKPDTELVLIVDRPDCCIYQAFIASIPNNPLFKLCAEKCVENIETNYYGKDCLDPTGPRMMGKVFYSLYGKCLEDYEHENLVIGVFEGKYIVIDDKKVIDSYAVNRYLLNYIWNLQTNKKYYATQWDNKKIYHM